MSTLNTIISLRIIIMIIELSLVLLINHHVLIHLSHSQHIMTNQFSLISLVKTMLKKNIMKGIWVNTIMNREKMSIRRIRKRKNRFTMMMQLHLPWTHLKNWLIILISFMHELRSPHMHVACVRWLFHWITSFISTSTQYTVKLRQNDLSLLS